MRQDPFSRCHPVVNFCYFVVVIGFGVVIQHPAYTLASLLAGGIYYLLLSGRKGGAMVRGILLFACAVALLNPLLNTQGKNVLFTVFGRPYTLQALCYGAALGGIFALTVLWFGCYSAVLTSDKFTALFGNLIPSLSLLLVMVLRLIPSFTRKAVQISGARSAIGKGTEASDSFPDKLHNGMGILSSLTDWALEGSIVTADAMRSRGYGSAKRTNFHIYRLTFTDGLLLVIMGLLAACVLLCGGTEATYTPRLYISYVTAGFPAYCVLLLIPIIMYIRELLFWKRVRRKI